MGRLSEINISANLDRIQKQHMDGVLRDMPKVYFVEDSYNGGYRVGRTDWPGDVFNIVPKDQFDTFLKIYKALNMPVIDLTYDDDGSEWEKIRS
jgi:hypothetical protein